MSDSQFDLSKSGSEAANDARAYSEYSWRCALKLVTWLALARLLDGRRPRFSGTPAT